MRIKEKSKKIVKRSSSILLPLEGLILIVLPFFLVHTEIILSSNFVKCCPSQYGPIIYSFMVAAFFSTGLQYFHLIIRDNMTIYSRGLVGLAMCILSGIIAKTYDGDYFSWKLDLLNARNELKLEDPFLFISTNFDFLALASLIFASCMLGAGLLQLKKEKTTYWRNQVFYIYLPLTLGLAAVFFFQLIYFSFVHEDYNTISLINFPSPIIDVYNWYSIKSAIQESIKTNFWIGFTAGIVTFQIFIFETISIIDRIVVNGRVKLSQ